MPHHERRKGHRLGTTLEAGVTVLSTATGWEGRASGARDARRGERTRTELIPKISPPPSSLPLEALINTPFDETGHNDPRSLFFVACFSSLQPASPAVRPPCLARAC